MFSLFVLFFSNLSLYKRKMIEKAPWTIANIEASISRYPGHLEAREPC